MSQLRAKVQVEEAYRDLMTRCGFWETDMIFANGTVLIAHSILKLEDAVRPSHLYIGILFLSRKLNTNFQIQIGLLILQILIHILQRQRPLNNPQLISAKYSFSDRIRLS